MSLVWCPQVVSQDSFSIQQHAPPTNTVNSSLRREEGAGGGEGVLVSRVNRMVQCVLLNRIVHWTHTELGLTQADTHRTGTDAG